MLYGFELEKRNNTKKIRRPANHGENQYTLIQVGSHYYISFKDGEGKKVETEVSEEIFTQMEEWVKEDYRKEWNDRYHLEQSDLTDESIARRAAIPSEPMDEMLERMSQTKLIEAEFLALNEIQERRVLMLLDEKTLVDIANSEGCQYQSIQNAVKRVQKRFEKFR